MAKDTPMGLPLRRRAWRRLDAGFVKTAEARISPLDRGFLFGDAVYEVMPVYAGRVFALDRHLKRLARSLHEVKVTRTPTAPMRAGASSSKELVVRNGGGDQADLPAGHARRRRRPRPSFPQGRAADRVHDGLALHPPTAAGNFAKGRSAFTQPDLRWGRCDIKTVMLMANCMAKEAAGERGGNEAVLVRDGKAMEGTSSTLYIVEERPSHHHAAAHERRILPGVTREVVFELAAALKVPVEERDIPLDRAVRRRRGLVHQHLGRDHAGGQGGRTHHRQRLLSRNGRPRVAQVVRRVPAAQGRGMGAAGGLRPALGAERR